MKVYDFGNTLLGENWVRTNDLCAVGISYFDHKLDVLFVLKDLFQRYSEGLGNLKAQCDGWNIFPLFECDNGLTSAASSIGQLFLCHFVVVET